MKIVFKQYPLPFHREAKGAAQATLAAHAQGKFWPMHDKLFQNYKTINRTNILSWAKELGLDVEKFTKDLDDPKTIAQIDKDMADGNKVGVQGTPSFFLNGKRYNGPRDLNTIKPLIEAEIKGTAAGSPAPEAKAAPRAGSAKPAPRAGSEAQPGAKPAASPAASPARP